jgi:hypothetical protein
MCSKADRLQREPTVDWCQTSGNHEYCANPMDALRYQRSSGVAEPPGRQAAAVRRSLEPDGCLARSVAAMKRRNGCDRLLHSVSRISIACSLAEGILCPLDTGPANGCRRFGRSHRPSLVGRMLSDADRLRMTRFCRSPCYDPCGAFWRHIGHSQSEFPDERTQTANGSGFLLRAA